jgi:hypothetical protein
MPTLLLPLLCAAASALPAEVVQRVKRGTVLIRVEEGEGSGFFLRDELVVSNAHVVGPPGSRARVVLESGTRAGQTVWGTVMAEDEERDLALVYVPGHPGRALALARDADTRETLSVVAAGFPRGSERALVGVQVDPPVSLRPGAVTALYRDEAEQLLLVEHNANMQQGSSGGPLVDEQGRVVGVNVAILRTDETSKLAVPVGQLSAWIATLADAPPRAAAPPQAAAPPAAAPASAPASFATVFEVGAVRDLAAGPDGRAYVLGLDGSLFRLDTSGRWEEFGANEAVTAVGMDAERNVLYVTSSVGPSIWSYVPDVGWEELRRDDYVSVAATHGRVYAVHRSGTVHVHRDGGWTDLELSGVREVHTCDGKALLRSTTELAALGPDDRLGEARLDDVRDFACVGSRGVLLRSGGVVAGFPSGDLLDRDPANERVFATARGLLLLSRPASGGALWWRGHDDEAWSRVPAR